MEESEAWRIAAETQGHSTLNKFIRTVVNSAILDFDGNGDEFEVQTQQKFDEKMHRRKGQRFRSFDRIC
ncbi:MAG: hypothetical protein CMA18_008055 [Methanobacteriota archaeon]|nr:MAG: hypothetical protein CBC63_00840 [Euryarchaeota archaeon TMED103]RAH08802.1 MAG: hypothetical protein CMA18_008055 [Euryarchaeota archaeon]